MKSNVLSVFSSSGKRQFAVASHTHEYWQLEIVTQGVVQSVVRGQQLDLDTGDLLLIPPGWEHEFTYDRPELSWTTIKFEHDRGERAEWGGLIRNSPFTSRLVSSFKAVVHGDAHKDYEKMFVNGFIDTVFQYAHSDDFANSDDASHQFVKMITEKVLAQNGRAITVNELADKLSYTRSHLSKKFKEITGENLKAYIDVLRMQKVEEQLRYRENSISDIAIDLGFNDLFSFSRFYKRHAGVSPRMYRNKAAILEEIDRQSD
ncbi:MAG: AraC family transcriptional regulator [Paenibacillus sp.]|nr:AraC family transcriptional regulator [Paenibacillus sp.]